MKLHRLLLVSLAMGTWIIPGYSSAAPVSALWVGMAPPAFTLPRSGGGEICFPADVRGKPVIIHFWASSCQFCLEEMPAMDRLYRQYASKGLTVLAINVGDKPAIISDFMTKTRVSYPVLMDTTSSLARAYEVTGLPKTIFIDRNGLVRYRILGPAPRETLAKLIQGIL
jgi:peroxiredoxin